MFWVINVKADRDRGWIWVLSSHNAVSAIFTNSSLPQAMVNENENENEHEIFLSLRRV